MERKHIVIVGGGFSGTLFLYHLVQCATSPLKITLLDENSAFAKGLAYSTGDKCHLLNVPATRMSALSENPKHFIEWLHGSGNYRGDTAFYSRFEYASYLQAILNETLLRAEISSHEVRLTNCKATDLRRAEINKISIGTSLGEILNADAVVLAMGNFPAHNFTKFLDRKYWDQVVSLHSAEAMKSLEPNSRVLVLGTGLSMVDAVLSLKKNGHRGKVFTLSRHGFLPNPHINFDQAFRFDSFVESLSPLQLLKFLRSRHRESISDGMDWRVLVDGLRSHTNKIWAHWSLKEKKQFLRHLRPIWDVHRHRMAPEIYHQILELKEKEMLQVIGARMERVEPGRNGSFVVQMLERKSQIRSLLEVDHLIDCSGTISDFLQSQDPLLSSLRKNFSESIESTGLGLNIVSDGKLNGDAPIYCIGPLRKGHQWETTAVPEIRDQTHEVAIAIVQELHLADRSQFSPPGEGVYHRNPPLHSAYPVETIKEN